MLPNHILKTFIFVSPKTGPAPLNVAEYERYAADTLSRNAHGYYATLRGAGPVFGETKMNVFRIWLGSIDEFYVVW